ncbi:unnamed protein product [Mytilus edulis]|uniref:Uncharacterized protein n=1 Tax=Mytilus edulis TaxID=6550 RepID=A0A8S3V294_MYTED|nr:unnamed protein product [Mytilus edulis]
MTRNKLNANAKRKLKDLLNNTDSSFDSPTQQPYKKGSKKLSKNNTSVHSIHEGLSSDKTPDNQKHAYNTQTSTPLQYPYPLPFPGPPPAHSGSYPSFSWPPPPVADNNVLGHIMQYITTIDSRLSNLENMDKKIDKLESFCENMENLYIRVKKTETGIETLTSQMTEVQDICVSHKIKLDELCVEKDTMWVAIAAGGAGSPGKGSKIKKELEQIQKQNEELKSTVTDLPTLVKSSSSLSQRQSSTSQSQGQTHTCRSRDSDSESADKQDNIMSLQPGQNEDLGSET